MNSMTPQAALLIASTMGAGWLMLTAGVEKKALEWRRRRRICGSCGKDLPGRSICTCAH
jgi:hypothetical protein